MTKSVVNYLLCFLAGLIVALGGVFAVEHSWRWNRLGGTGFSRLVDSIGTLSPAVVACAALFMLATTLLTFYWSNTAAFAARMFSRAGDGVPAEAEPASAADTAAGGAGANDRDVNAVRDELEKQLGRLIVLIANQLQNSQAHVTSLNDANAHLARVTSVSDLRQVIGSLISSNQTNEQQTRDLEARLKAAQDQAKVLRQRLTQAEKLASLDPLTSVANRRCFERFIYDEVARSHQDGTPLCLVMTDIDHFKKVNDTHGHSAGDQVLKSFAELLSRHAREGDLVARYGGEEFAIVLPRTPTGDAYGVAERMRRVFERQGLRDHSAGKGFGRLTASFGVAEIREGEPPSALIQRADQKLYEAKNKGRNRTVIWSTTARVLETS